VKIKTNHDWLENEQTRVMWLRNVLESVGLTISLQKLFQRKRIVIRAFLIFGFSYGWWLGAKLKC